MKKYMLLAAVAAMIPAAALAQDTDGARIEARIGYETPTVSYDDSWDDDDVYKLGSAVSYGAEIGYDIKAGEKLRVGPYVNYELSSVKNCDSGVCGKVKGTWAAGARIGYALSERGVIYGKVGYADMKIRVTDGNFSETAGHGGIQAALGYEGNVGKSMYWKIEGVYSDNGELFDLEGVNVQRRQLVAGLGFRF